MAGPYTPLVKNAAGGWIGYIALQSFATPGAYQASPTIASGDFKVSIDGGALANLGTLPSVAPASSIWVLITLSQAEVNGDNIQIQCIDQTATKEWGDYAFLLQTSAYTQTVAQTGDSFARIGAAGAGLTAVDDAILAVLGSAVGASLSADIAAIKAVAGALNDAASSGDPGTSTTVISFLKQLVNTLEGSAGIPTWAAAAAPANAVSIAEAIRSIYTQIGVAGAGLTAADDAVITAIAALNNVSQANVSTAVLAAVVEGTETLQQNLRLVRAAAAGKLDGAAGTTIHMRDAADTKNRITATVDTDGNRSAITTDVT